MRVSLNEIERTVERGARGAGAAPGADTELGLAAAWLEARGVPVLAAVARALEVGRPEQGALVLEGPAGRRRVAARGGAIAAHALPVLADLAAAEGGRVEAASVDVPALLIPAAWGYAARGIAFEMSWRDAADGRAASARIGPGVAWEGAIEAAGGRDVVVACRAMAGARGDAPAPSREGVEVADAAWATLLRLAHRTYVPASTLSRSRGAGAEVDDSA